MAWVCGAMGAGVWLHGGVVRLCVWRCLPARGRSVGCGLDLGHLCGVQLVLLLLLVLLLVLFLLLFAAEIGYRSRRV